jgi:cbb3-type cytochrome oxidase subunit 3
MEGSTMTTTPDPRTSAADTDPLLNSGAADLSSSVPSVATGPATGVRQVGKTRNPWGVFLLSIITLGIYGLWWYYTINREVRDYDRSIEVEPGLSVLAQFVPIVNFVSIFRSGERINTAQRSAGSTAQCSPLVGFLLVFVLGTWIVYYQSQINKVWDMHGNPEPGTTV